ncbi:hypothetical protein RN001_014399 [Aquatica leii]|uniref:Pro-resilin n=1 Tax=Aquatica leii TaxID=1421715 RepID=A0AAN7SN51_9COLE|nr:hypothetical protein RN001_014399 [Aquatica leii]
MGRCEPPSAQYGAPISSYGTPNYNADYNHEHSAPKSYEFGYQVKDDYSGNNYNRQETSDGNQVNGEYRVQLPDGRLQIVTYYADWQTGFHADVRYEGTAHYPENYGHGGYNGPSGQYGVPNQYGPPGFGASAPATSSVSIKDYSGPDTPYRTDGGYHHGGYDSYNNPANYGNRLRPGNTYGAP